MSPLEGTKFIFKKTWTGAGRELAGKAEDEPCDVEGSADVVTRDVAAEVFGAGGNGLFGVTLAAPDVEPEK